MKPTLELKMGQQLTLTPQLQQAINLLQLSTLDLETEIQKALDDNPMLELQEEVDTVRKSDAEHDNPLNRANATEHDPQTELNLEKESMPTELPVDSAWDDVYQPTASLRAHQHNHDIGNLEAQRSQEQTLQSYLYWQMAMTSFSDSDLLIANAIIDSIDEEGFLQTTVEDIAVSMGVEFVINTDDVLTVLQQIQRFDPIGVGARDLQECLLLQLKQLPESLRWRDKAQQVLTDYLDLLVNHEYKKLMRKCQLKEDELTEVVRFIQSLNPRPGRKLSNALPSYIIPDVMVKKQKQGWTVELSNDMVPRLQINHHYASLVQRADSSADNVFLRDHLQEARWFLKSLQSRNDTLLKVAACIVEQQRGFLEYGEEAMKPLVLHDVAEMVGMHESTISRITTQKYMHTPRGVFELKYFFSSHVTTANGGECSSTAIRALIKKAIAAEIPQKPLSDNKLSQLLQDQGINVARRTVAKYREAMAIPSSNERKSLF